MAVDHLYLVTRRLEEVVRVWAYSPEHALELAKKFPPQDDAQVLSVEMHVPDEAPAE